MCKTTRQVQQMSPLDPYEYCVQKTGNGDSNHTDKGRPSELIWTREDHGGDIGADLEHVLPSRLSRGEGASCLGFDALWSLMNVRVSSSTQNMTSMMLQPLTS